jgi:O-antigen ligase
MLIKYFPEIGKYFSQWGVGQSSGVTNNKNALGRVCMILGLFLFWHLLKILKLEKSIDRRNELRLTALLLWMVWWNMLEAKSSTALMSLMLGMLMVVAVGWPIVSKRFVGTYVVTAVCVVFAADALFGVYEGVINLLGEDATLTGRTDLWRDILAIDINPLIGVGYESFWIGERLEYFRSLYWWSPNQAHNGYLEVYINLGLIGLFLAVCVLLATFRKASVDLLSDYEYGRLRLGWLAAIVVFNWTEAGFRPMGVTIFFIYLIATNYPVVQATVSHALDGVGQPIRPPWSPPVARGIRPVVSVRESAIHRPLGSRRSVNAVGRFRGVRPVAQSWGRQK